MAEWGRKEYAKPWPSRARWWTLGAVLLTIAFFVFAVWLDGYENWTAAERGCSRGTRCWRASTYSHQDTNGNLLKQVLRYPGKGFSQRRPARDGGWITNTDGVPPILHNLMRV